MAAACLCFAVAIPPLAQGAQAKRAPANSQTSRRAARLHRRRQIEKALHLTPEQKAKLKTIFQAQRKQVLALRKNHHLTRGQRRHQLIALRLATNRKIKQVLTPEQWKKWQKLVVHRRHHRRLRRKA